MAPLVSAGPEVRGKGGHDAERTLETLLGTVHVTREGHGTRGRETLFPLDAALNLPVERYSFGAEAILRLRSVRASGDGDAYWRHHEQREQQRNHVARYADATIPPLTPPVSPVRRKVTTPHLRIVK